MFVLKKTFSLKFSGSSLVESVISMGVISICLFFMVMVFTVLYTKNKKVDSKLSASVQNDIFYLSCIDENSLGLDSVREKINRVKINDNLIEIFLKQNDSIDDSYGISFFILKNNENVKF
jgi:hypothetical protein